MAIFDLLQREPDVRAFRAGETVFTEGDPGDCMFAVIEGEVAIQKNGIILERVGVGGVFGEIVVDRPARAEIAIVHPGPFP